MNRDNYVSNLEEILSANDTQRNKIEFLQRERIRRDAYLQDLEQSLKLNKEIIRELNMQGPNLQAIDSLVRENIELSSKLGGYYSNYQDINAMVLMERQLRVQDRAFYNQRMIQFENKINDLRKYLHDKEDSFSSVVSRLRRYQDGGETTVEQKLHDFKDELGKSCTTEFVSLIAQERNRFRSMYEDARKEVDALDQIANLANKDKQKYSEIVEIIGKRGRLYKQTEKKREQDVREVRENSKRAVNPNKQLIRLLKKEKLTNQIIEEALNDAIEKNEELLSFKQTLGQALSRLEARNALLQAENVLLSLRIGEYDYHYCRRVCNNRRFLEQGEKRGFHRIVEQKIMHYSQIVERYANILKQLRAQNNEKMRQDVTRWTNFICESACVKRKNQHKGFLLKSSSQPRLLLDFELEGMESGLQIEEY